MKIKDQQSFAQQPELFAITNSLSVTISPIKASYLQVLRQRLPPPEPPVGPIPRADGTGFLKDGGKLASGPNFKDHGYLIAANRHGMHMLAGTFCAGIKADPDVSFDAVEPTDNKPGVWVTYYQQVVDEMDAADFPLDRLVACSTRIMDLSGLSNDIIRKQAEDFSQGA